MNTRRAIQNVGSEASSLTAEGRLVNVSRRASLGMATLGFSFCLFLMVNVPFLLGVWDWTVQPFYRR
jgi:hypothetical protein